MLRTLRLGIFVVAMLLILAAGIFMIGRRDFMFSSTYRLKADFQNVAGLGGGAPVRVGGIHQGTVRTILLPKQPDGKVTVVMDLESGTRNIIKKDSLAAIKTEGLLGSKYVEISFGTKEAERVNNGDTLATEPPLDIADLIKKTNDILDTSKSAVQNVDKATGNLESISAKIDQGKGTVGALINDKTVFQEAKEGAAGFRDNMEALRSNFLLRGFFRKRGYEDSANLTKHEIPRLPREAYTKRFVYDALQVFDKPNTAKFKNQKVLNEAGRFLEQNKFGLAVVAASTGKKGDAEKGRELTQARAMVVRDYLAQNFGLDDTRIKTIGLGETSEAGDSSKVEILVYPVGAAAPKQTAGNR